jgi:hypothetical protein
LLSHFSPSKQKALKQLTQSVLLRDAVAICVGSPA